jgi:DNA polymerase III subunit delta'
VSLIGHEVPWREWRGALAGPRMHHAWILGGRRGLGKGAFALQAARQLVAEEGVPQPEGDHPDILLLSHLPKDDKEDRKRDEGKPYERKRNISVDQVRSMQQRLNTRPTLGSRRAIVIDPADDLEKSAANALLKSLEEPPAGTYFLLVTHRLGRLLPTIRSRCRLLGFRALEERELDRILQHEASHVDAATRRAAIAAAAGSPGAALEFVSLDLAEIYGLMSAIAENGDPGFARRGKLAEALGSRPDRRRQMAALDLARAVATERMRSGPRSALPTLADTHAELVRLTAQAPTYNFDAGLLVMEIGTLLASLAVPREAAHG